MQKGLCNVFAMASKIKSKFNHSKGTNKKVFYFISMTQPDVPITNENLLFFLSSYFNIFLKI